MGTGTSSGLGGDMTCGLRDVEWDTECKQARPPELVAETKRKSQFLFSADPNLYISIMNFYIFPFSQPNFESLYYSLPGIQTNIL